MNFFQLKDAIKTQLDENQPFQDRPLFSYEIDDIASQLSYVLAEARCGAPDAVARQRLLRGAGVPGAQS